MKQSGSLFENVLATVTGPYPRFVSVWGGGGTRTCFHLYVIFESIDKQQLITINYYMCMGRGNL